MEIRTDFQDKKQWNRFILENINPAPFVQSWDWGEFNEQSLKNKVSRWTMIEEKKLVMVGTMIAKELPAQKKYWYCPRGVIWHKDYMDRRALGYNQVLKNTKINFTDEIFLRIAPPYPKKDYFVGFFKRLGLSKPKILIRSEEPEQTIVLDLNKPEDELLANMHQKTRYNIKLAEKKGVTVRETTKDTLEQDLNIFYNLSKQTADRNNIKIYNKEYYQKFIDFFWNRDGFKIKLYIAEKDKQPLVAIIILYFGTTATYIHGASDNNYRNLMPSYLAQWQAITQAKKDRMKAYDFWGVSETKPAWAGITKFKQGFGGREINYIGTWDYILNKKWYNIFRVFKIIKRIIKK